MTLNQDSDCVVKTIDVQQSLISRMASTSGTVKNWCVTLVTAIIVFAVDKDKPQFLLVALIPVLLFLALDIYYLTLERKFRAQYDLFVSKIHDNSVATSDLFIIQSSAVTMRDTIAAFCSVSIWPFYLLLSLATLVAATVMLTT